MMCILAQSREWSRVAASPKAPTTDLGRHSAEHLMAVENELNHRPRRVLQDRAPVDLFTALLASKVQPVLRR